MPLGYLTMWAAGQQQPLVSNTNSPDGRTKSTFVIVASGPGGTVNAFASNTTDLVVDVFGYFVSATAVPSALQFFPLTPCRIADTRQANGTFGGSMITGQSTRSFPILSSSCNIPGTAAAYALNLTVVPVGSPGVGYLTAWPTGQNQPFASSVNATTPAPVANLSLLEADRADRSAYTHLRIRT